VDSTVQMEMYRRLVLHYAEELEMTGKEVVVVYFNVLFRGSELRCDNDTVTKTCTGRLRCVKA
jgi:hypothetical protein